MKKYNYVPIPKDLSRVKRKVALGLTKRQLVCFSIAAVIGLPFYFLTRKLIGNSNAATAMVLIMLPAFLFAMYEKDGLPLEKVLKNYMNVHYYRPQIRVYDKKRAQAAVEAGDREKAKAKTSGDNTIDLSKYADAFADDTDDKSRDDGSNKERSKEKSTGKSGKSKKTGKQRKSKNKVPRKQRKKDKKEAKKRAKLQKAKDERQKAMHTARLGKNKGKTMSTQDSIPYQEMCSDGICRVEDGLYSKTIRFYDINYQLAQSEDQSVIFNSWCDFLNYFDETIQFQISFINLRGGMKEFVKIINISPQHDKYDDIRLEYDKMLKRQLAKGNNGLMKTKYITFAIHAKDIKEARPKLERIEADIINNFKVFGVKAYALNGAERLKIMYETLNPAAKIPFTFSYEKMRKYGLITKDFVAPDSFTFSNGKYFKIGKKYGAVSYMNIIASDIRDEFLMNLLDTDENQIINMHIQSIEQGHAIKKLKQAMTDINSMKIDEQKRALRSGYDMDILPADLMTYGDEAKKQLGDLQSRNERMFIITIIFLHTADDLQQLENIMLPTLGLATQNNCPLIRLENMQEEGLMSSLMLGKNLVPIKRTMTTTATAIFVPFTTQELFMEGESLYYGLNAISNNMILVDRKQLKNPNGLILGTPGSGKSFAAKREIANAFFVTQDDIIVCDPESEYHPLVMALGGQVIHISSTSRDYINPMDINLDYSDDDNPLGFKSDFILSLCELIMGSRHGIEAEERSVIDRCLPIVYRKYFEDPRPENMPVLGDLYDILKQQPEPQAHRIATALEIYVNGSLKVFNHQTNVKLDNRIVCFDIKDLGKQLKKLGMLIVQDQVWNRVTINRYSNKSTRYYIDEFHLLLKEEQTAAYSVEIWKRFRKWGGIPTAITQNIKDLLASREIENIFEDSDFIIMLNQAAGDRQILAKQLNISDTQLSYVTNSGEGEGLIFYGNIIIPFRDRFDKNTMLYKYITTKFSDRLELDAAKHLKVTDASGEDEYSGDGSIAPGKHDRTVTVLKAGFDTPVVRNSDGTYPQYFRERREETNQ